MHPRAIYSISISDTLGTYYLRLERLRHEINNRHAWPMDTLAP